MVKGEQVLNLEASWRANPVRNLATERRRAHADGMLSVDEQIELEIRARAELDKLRTEATDEVVDPQAVAVDVAIGRLSRLDSMQMEEVRKAATRSRNQRIHELQEAVRKMDDGSYGLCEGCGEWIAYARLEQRPEAILCGDCSERMQAQREN